MSRAVVLGPISLSFVTLFLGCQDETNGGPPNALEAGTADSGGLAVDAARPSSPVDDAGAGDGAARDGAALDGGADAAIDGASVVTHVTFERAGGANTYAKLDNGNWVTPPDGGSEIAASSGTQWFGSGNGNASGTFTGLGLTKNLGGTVEARTYTVSFYVAQHVSGAQAMTAGQFTRLRIGGPKGTVTWTSTPPYAVFGQWVQWVGTYVPDPADVGGPFFFEALFDLEAQHTVAFDGPIVVTPSP